MAIYNTGSETYAVGICRHDFTYCHIRMCHTRLERTELLAQYNMMTLPGSAIPRQPGMQGKISGFTIMMY